jgi:hypothetical protein
VQDHINWYKTCFVVYDQNQDVILLRHLLIRGYSLSI